MPDTFTKYGMVWQNEVHPLQVEMWAIRQSDEWRAKAGTTLSFHYEQFRRICWPELDGEHNGQRWHKLCRDEIVNNKVTVLMGPGSSGKTHEAAWIFLVEYWCYPEETCVLVSSTQVAQLRKRVWGEIADLWQRGVDQFDFLGGHLLDSAIAITTDDIADVEEGQRKTRDMRKGIFGIACVQGGKFVGLNRFVGIKQKRMRLIADEASWMGESFLSAFANLNKNISFKAVVLGNPNDPIDPLGRAAEPAEGWTDEYMEPKETKVWNTRFMNGRCVNLIGTTSPNWDFPGDKIRFPYLISKKTIDETLSFFAKDSHEYYSQCVGSMKIGTMARRVLTRDLCLKNHALEQPIWEGETTKVYFVDSSYGGDACVAGWGEFGLDIHGKRLLAFSEPKIIPISPPSDTVPDAEYQIAHFVRADCEANQIPGSHMGHDSTGRGGLGTAIAKVWSADTHPIEFGGSASKRIVSLDELKLDEETGQRRHVLCNERYDRMVSELWLQVRKAVEAEQIRSLPEECLSDLTTRKWDRVKKDLISVEPKSRTSTNPERQGMKQRTGRSPDHGDWACGILEMARRKGFNISRLVKQEAVDSSWSWFHDLQSKSRDTRRRHELNFSV